MYSMLDVRSRSIFKLVWRATLNLEEENANLPEIGLEPL